MHMVHDLSDKSILFLAKGFMLLQGSQKQMGMTNSFSEGNSWIGRMQESALVAADEAVVAR